MTWTDITLAQIIHAFTPTVGAEESRDVVLAAAKGMGLHGELLNHTQSLELLGRLAEQDGIVGITARYVTTRVESGRQLPEAPSGPDSDPSSAPRLSLSDGWPAAIDTAEEPVFERARLVELLARNLGSELAEESVAAMARTLRLGGDAYTQDEALSLLDGLASKPGVVGVTARFVKARLILRNPR